MMTRVYGHDIEDVTDDVAAVDAIAHEQTWTDMRPKSLIEQMNKDAAERAAIDSAGKETPENPRVH